MTTTPPLSGRLVVLSDLHLGQEGCTEAATRVARACAERWGGADDVAYVVAGDVCEGVNLRAELDAGGHLMIDRTGAPIY